MEYVWYFLATVIVVLAATSLLLARISLVQRNSIKKLKTIRDQSLLVDLELATREQLFDELRSRTGKPYLLVSPEFSADHHGITIEAHNISPIPCLHMLHMATSLTFRELKKRGADVSDFSADFDDNEDIHNDGEEWKN